jgi:hypothetical protein
MSIANVLLRGLGSGLQSYGASTFQQQEQRRREEAAEALRVRQAQEQGEQRRLLEGDKAAERQRQAQEAAALARALKLEIPEGMPVTSEGVRLLLGQQQYDRTMAAQAAQTERNTATNDTRREIAGMNNDARAPLIESQVGVNNARVPLMQSQMGVNNARVGQIGAQTDYTNARTGQVGVTPMSNDDKERTKAFREQVQKLMSPRFDQYGDMISEGLSAEDATMRAQRIIDAMYGRQGGGPAAAAAPAEAATPRGVPEEAQLSLAAQRKIAEIMASDEDEGTKRQMVQQVNQILSQRIQQLRGR